ncbi:hypothetical protein AVENP_1751 [Arcobacter venerupis]|uniref:Uncharacterized protein n=1 Tax=Arcobacter venerupis TaxID=1054033 RepID=A0AAE7E4T1_9BACT|nr:hypothetical protein AVENP_1751 [Arcobacter venerupis]
MAFNFSPLKNLRNTFFIKNTIQKIKILGARHFKLNARALNIPYQSNSDKKNPISPELKF